MNKITVHTVVKNEDQWIWYALTSVLPFVEKILVFDTGSSDQTIRAIKSINSEKIIFEGRVANSAKDLAGLRQEQILRTKTDWFLILDGDEIWPQKQLKKLLEQIDQSSLNTIAFFNKVKNCIGDVYHFLPEEAGKYQICGVRGNLNIRLVKKTPTMKVVGSYPLEIYQDTSGPIQKQCENLKFSDAWYLHTTYLKRSSFDQNKVSGSFGGNRIWQKGINLTKDLLPEVLSRTRPADIPSPFRRRSWGYETLALFTTPIINLRRKLS